MKSISWGIGWSALATIVLGLTLPGMKNLSIAPYVPIFGPLIGVLSTILAFFFGQWLARYTISEAAFRSDLSLNISVEPRLIYTKNTTNNRLERIIEIRVNVTNNSRRMCCIPAIYVQSRALIANGRQALNLESDFGRLTSCEKLSNPINVARISNSIIQLAPDETESFVRWDTIDGEFVRKFPVIVANVEAFGADGVLMGERHIPHLRRGNLRTKWLEYMEKNHLVENGRVLFERWTGQESADVPFAKNQRILVLQDTGAPDVENSRVFKAILDSTVQWTRHVTIDLRQEDDFAENSGIHALVQSEPTPAKRARRAEGVKG